MTGPKIIASSLFLLSLSFAACKAASASNFTKIGHRTISTLINDIVSAGFIIEECQESKVPESIREKRTDMFGGVIHQPDFIFFRCGKKN